jgi:hypothetical protein
VRAETAERPGPPSPLVGPPGPLDPTIPTTCDTDRGERSDARHRADPYRSTTRRSPRPSHAAPPSPRPGRPSMPPPPQSSRSPTGSPSAPPDALPGGMLYPDPGSRGVAALLRAFPTSTHRLHGRHHPRSPSSRQAVARSMRVELFSARAYVVCPTPRPAERLESCEPASLGIYDWARIQSPSGGADPLNECSCGPSDGGAPEGKSGSFVPGSRLLASGPLVPHARCAFLRRSALCTRASPRPSTRSQSRLASFRPRPGDQPRSSFRTGASAFGSYLAIAHRAG